MLKKNKKDLKIIIRKIHLYIEFNYKDEFYIKEYRSESKFNTEIDFISKANGDIIYKSHPYYCTDEGKEVLEAIQKELHSNVLGIKLR